MREPDFERIRTAAGREEGEYVPPAELLIHYSIQSAFLGREVTDDDVESQVEFWTKAGYDFIPITVGMMNPGKVTEDSAISKVIKERVVTDSGKDGDSWNLEKNSFIADRGDFERFPWDALGALDFSKFDQAGALLPERMKVIALSGKIFTLTWMLMGFNNFATKLVLDEDLVADVFRKVAEIQLDSLEQIFAMPHVGAVWLVDDLAFGTGPMISPEAFRTHLFPWYRRIADLCHERGLLVFFHTDGDLVKLMDDLVDIGVDVLHPIDPHCMDIVDLKETYGDRLCIAGNVSNELLRSASPAEIEERVRYLMENVAPGGGFLLGSGNSVAEWSRFENYMAMRAAAFRYGVYPVKV
jgi:uroporphyrinogen decarboxylase